VRESITSQTSFNDLPEFMTTEEIRAYLRLGRSTIYELLRRGELPHVRFGRAIRVPKAALARYLSKEGG
jgi:excisionase family DNA binding protein